MLLPGGSNVPGSIRTKILICRALVSSPKLLLFEEFFSKLEFKDQKRIAKALAEETGDSTVIVISNNPVIAAYFQRIVVLKQGEIVTDSPAEKIKETPYYEEVFFGGAIGA